MTSPGPRLLGRGVVVGAGAVPTAWAGVGEVVVDEAALAAPAEVVTALHRAWASRTPVVVRLRVDAGRFRAPRSYTAEPWTLPADFEAWEDRLQFLVWANNYDARSDPADPVWWWGRKAERLGAGPAPAGGDVVLGDVVLGDGRPAWIDGGPRRTFAPGDVSDVAIVHRESVERDRLDVAPGPCPPEAALAPDQLAAVAHAAGPARIIAPAGSGKTRVLTARLRHLVVDRRWERDAVLAVAYNKKAQQELDARCGDFAPRTRTLNSLGLAILARARGRAPAVLEEREVRRIVERLAPAQRRRVNTDPIGPYLEALGAIRLGLRDPEEVEGSRDDVPGLAALWPGFRAELADRQVVDFDEQVYGAVEALLSDGDLRAREQLACRHLLVDEFQDLTPAHVLLLRLLCTPGLDCFGVGDDDQVIYGHAGADPAFLIDYERLFPGAGDHPLEVNYRCPPDVVSAAAHLLSYNHRRVAKVIRAAGGKAGEDPGLTVRRHAGGGGAADLAAVVSGWLQAGHAPGSIAVLSRVNSMLLAPHVALVEAGIPVDSVVRPDLVTRTGLRAALAYLRIATAPEGEIAGRDIVEILRRPSRSLPPWFAGPDPAPVPLEYPDPSGPHRVGAGEGCSQGRAPRRRPGCDPGRGRRRDWRARLLQLVRVDIGLGSAMSLLDGGRGGEGTSHVDDLEALEQVARLHEDAATLEPWLIDRLQRPADPGGVVLSTVHRVKGMEWDRVAVYGVTAGIVPHRLAEDEEEERRVLHVGITRGREEVVVLVDTTRPSPFVDELSGAAPHEAADRPRAAGLVSASTAGAGRRRDRGSRRSPAPEDIGDPGLEDALRAWRRDRAKADGVPAYVVFADRTLQAIAARRPSSLVALRAVDGIGPTKLELYGEDVLALVAAAGRGEETG